MGKVIFSSLIVMDVVSEKNGVMGETNQYVNNLKITCFREKRDTLEATFFSS